MAASLPPSSSTTGRVVAAAAAMTAWPVPHAAGEGDHVDAGVAHQRRAERGAGTVHDVEDAGRQHLGHGRGHQQHRARAGRGRLDHDRVAGQQRRQHLVAHDRDGPVERQDRGHDAVGHPLDAGRPRRSRSRAASASATSGAKAAAMPPMVAVSKIASRWVLPCSRVSSRARSWRLDGGDARLGRRRRPAPPARRWSAPPTPAGDRRAARHGHGRAGPARSTARRARPRPVGPGSSPGRCRRPRPPTSPSMTRPTPGRDVLDVCGHAHPRAGRLS